MFFSFFYAVSVPFIFLTVFYLSISSNALFCVCLPLSLFLFVSRFLSPVLLLWAYLFPLHAVSLSLSLCILISIYNSTPLSLSSLRLRISLCISPSLFLSLSIPFAFRFNVTHSQCSSLVIDDFLLIATSREPLGQISLERAMRSSYEISLAPTKQAEDDRGTDIQTNRKTGGQRKAANILQAS